MKFERTLWNILLVIYLITVVSSVTYAVMAGEIGRKAVQFWFSGIYCMCTGIYLLFSSYADKRKSECKEVKEQNNLSLVIMSILQNLFLIVAICLFVVEIRIVKNGDMGSISIMVLVLIMEQCKKKIEAQTA